MLTIKDRRQVHFLDTKNILWIEAQDNYVRIHAADQDILYRATLSSIEKKLGTVRFQRIHRSHIVNISQISRINFSPKSTSTLKLRSGEELNIGKKYLAKVKEILKNGLEKF